MKPPKTTLLAIVALSLPFTAFAQKAVNSETEQTLTKLEQDMSAALTKHDAAAADAMITSDAYFVDPDGSPQTKAEFLADLKSGDLKLESNKLEKMKVQVANADMAVVTYESTDKGTYKGKDISGHYAWMDVAVKRDGHWQFVLSQGTPIAGKKP